jgi:spore coat polysaccharide biosynthesis protein SpsF
VSAQIFPARSGPPLAPVWRRDRPVFALKDILDLLAARPDIAALNAMHVGVNWYREHLHELRTVTAAETREKFGFL